MDTTSTGNTPTGGVLITLLGFCVILLLASCSGESKQTNDLVSIEDVVGIDFHKPEAFTEEIERAHNELVALCMKNQGFEWEPDPKVETVYTAPDDELEPGTREWVMKYGFDTSTHYFPQSQLTGGLVGFAGDPDLSNWESPNDLYYETLDPLEREAYVEALEGDTGCYLKALREAREESPLGIFGTAFGADIKELRQRVASDSRLAKYDGEVLECLRESGIEFTSLNAVEEHIYRRLKELQSLVGNKADADSSSGLPDGVPNRSDSQSDSTVLSREALEELADIQAEEVQIAVSFYDCGQNSKRRELLDELWAEYESEFVNENRAELIEIRAALEPTD